MGGRRRRRGGIGKQSNNNMTLHMSLSISTLNVNGLNALTKKHRIADWVRKQDPYMCGLQEIHLRLKDTYRLKVKSSRKMFHANGKEKKMR